MSIPLEHAISCSNCDYVYNPRRHMGPASVVTERVYSNGAGETFPLLTRRGWCQECNTITFHEHIPGASEIDSFIDSITNDLKKFESGENEWLGNPQADYARLVIKNRAAWHNWRPKRSHGRCLVCGSNHVIKIDPQLFSKWDGKLPFDHPGCGGSLIFGTFESLIRCNYGRRQHDTPITYIPYSYAGLPIGLPFEEANEKLEAIHPGLPDDLRAMVPRVAATGTGSAVGLSLPSISDEVVEVELTRAVTEFVRRELNDQAPDPNNGASLQLRFPEIHRFAAVLIRDIIEKLPASQWGSTTPPPPHLGHSEKVTTSIHKNPFHILGVTTRDGRRRIVEQAEERSLHIDHDLCQKARADLTNPRARLSAEMAWMPGVAPRVAEKLTKALLEDPLSVRSEDGLPKLAQANVLAAAFELMQDDEPAGSIAELIRDFAWLAEYIDAEDVLRDINEDRAISGFPEVKVVEAIEEELAKRRKAYRSTLKGLLDTMDPEKLVETMTDTVAIATDSGEDQGPALIDELVDTYEIETQGFLQKEYENIVKLVASAREAAPRGETAVAPIVDQLGKVARNWDRVAQPIQLSFKPRGIVHRPSRDVAYELRSLGIELNNEHGMLEQAYRMTELLQELFAELTEVVEKLGEDAETISDLRQQAQVRKRKEAQRERDITFRAEIGVMFKDELSISPEGIGWKGKLYPLEAITRVRWGGVRKSVNGIPTGTDYTIGFGDNRTEQVIQLKKESTYSGFIDALWKGVCVRMMYDMVVALEEGRAFGLGDMKVEDGAVTLTKHKFLASNEKVRLPWNYVHVWSSDGSLFIGMKDDKKTYGSSSYINNWNTHLLEHIIRGGLKKGVSKLSNYLRD